MLSKASLTAKDVTLVNLQPADALAYITDQFNDSVPAG